MPCTQLPCVVAYRAARRARERRRVRARARAQLRVVTSQPASDGDTAAAGRWAEARDEEDGAAAEAGEAGSPGRGSQYWLQPIAPAARMGVEQLAAVIERIADAATDVRESSQALSRALWSSLA